MNIFVALCLGMAAALADRVVHAAEPAIRISVNDAYVHGLVVGASDVFGQDAVVANFPFRRVSMQGTFDSADPFFAALATALDGRSAKVNGVHLLKPGCVADAPDTGDRLPLRDKAVSVAFNRVSVGALLGLVAEQNGITLQGSSRTPDQQVVGVRMTKRSWRDVLRATVGATGATLSVDDAGAVAMVGLAPAACVALTPPDAPAAPTPRHCPMKDHPLMKRSGTEPVCEPLEAYRLEDLTVRGFIDFRSNRSVLLEGPDRLTFFVKVGDYLGHHMGKIVRMDEGGFVVREVQQDPAGLYFHAETHVGYDNQRTAMGRAGR